MMTAMAKTKAPAARGFTLAEKRSLLFEQVSLYAVFLVALIAAVISFVALTAVGRLAGLGNAAYLLPLAIDGFGIACSVGIVRSVASGERWTDRVSEWLGLVGALVLSILGNVQHSLDVGAASLPDYVKIAYATAIPMIVAYGIHVYGRAMVRGISAHVLADNPDELVFGLAHLGDENTVARAHAPAKVTRAPAARPATVRAPEAAPTVAVRAQAPTPMRVSEDDAEKVRARALFDAAVTADPIVKPDAKRIHDDAGVQRNPATTRRWVKEWWEQHEAAMGTVRPEPADPAVSSAREDDKAATPA